jgi:hypothetical protein
LAWLGLAWLGLAWLGLAWLGLAWLGLAWLQRVKYPVNTAVIFGKNPNYMQSVRRQICAHIYILFAKQRRWSGKRKKKKLYSSERRVPSVCQPLAIIVLWYDVSVKNTSPKYIGRKNTWKILYRV